MTKGELVLDNGQSSMHDHVNVHESQEKQPKSWPELPTWAASHVHPSNRSKHGDKLNILEWDDSDNGNKDNGAGPSESSHDVTEYRRLNGWKGNDLVHSKSSPVRILEYRLSYSTGTTENTPSSPSSSSSNIQLATLTGIVHFTKNAESHKGFCHGGSMCSIMDDIIGWTGFCATGKCIPWSGFTVQVNTKLCKPVKVGSILKITCSVEKMERRKVWLRAHLTDPSNDNNENNISSVKDFSIHAIGEGMVILNKGVMEGS